MYLAHATTSQPPTFFFFHQASNEWNSKRVEYIPVEYIPVEYIPLFFFFKRVEYIPLVFLAHRVEWANPVECKKNSPNAL